MNKKWIYAIVFIVCIFIVVIITILYNAQKKQNILADEENQVKALYEIYNDFISSSFTQKNIKLDESALKNIITSSLFNQNNQEKLKELEKITNDSNLYILSYNYNEDIHFHLLDIELKFFYLHYNYMKVCINLNH